MYSLRVASTSDQEFPSAMTGAPLSWERLTEVLRREASPRHAPALVIEAPDLPHTRSGKLVELAVRDVISGRPVKNLEAIANPQSLRFFADLPALAPRLET